MANVRPGAIWPSVHEGFITNLFLWGTLRPVGNAAATRPASIANPFPGERGGSCRGRGGCRQVRPTPVRKNRPVVVASAAVKPEAARAASISRGW